MKRDTYVNAEQRTVEVVRATKPTSTADAVACTWKFDYSDCTPTELLELATAEMVIRQQRVWRGLEASDRKAAATGTIDVAEFIRTTRERGPVVPTAKSVGKQIDKMSDDERAALLKQLGVK